MKHVITISENGEVIKKSVGTKGYNYDFYEKVYDAKIEEYRKRGYKTIREASSSERSYAVLFNEDEMKSAVVSATFYTESDFVDADGQPIILSELYRSEENGDRYSIHQSSWAYKGGLYIRNVSRCDSHVETVNGHVQMSRTVGDKYDFDQEYIDSLKLHREK